MIFNKVFNRKKKCEHVWRVYEISNAMRRDSMGYVQQLVNIRCKKCGKITHKWIDVSEEILDKVINGQMFMLEWESIDCNKHER